MFVLGILLRVFDASKLGNGDGKLVGEFRRCRVSRYVWHEYEYRDYEFLWILGKLPQDDVTLRPSGGFHKILREDS